MHTRQEPHAPHRSARGRLPVLLSFTPETSALPRHAPKCTPHDLGPGTWRHDRQAPPRQRTYGAHVPVGAHASMCAGRTPMAPPTPVKTAGNGACQPPYLLGWGGAMPALDLPFWPAHQRLDERRPEPPRVALLPAFPPRTKCGHHPNGRRRALPPDMSRGRTTDSDAFVMHSIAPPRTAAHAPWQPAHSTQRKVAPNSQLTHVYAPFSGSRPRHGAKQQTARA